MELKVISEKYNPVMKRKELNIEISHGKTGTPDRISLRESIINKFKYNKDNSYVIKLETDTGTNRSLCYAEIYDDVEYARNVVPKYIIERNFPSEKEEKPKEEAKPEKPVETAAEEKPKEEKPQAESEKEEKPKEEAKPEKPVETAAEEKPKEETK